MNRRQLAFIVTLNAVISLVIALVVVWVAELRRPDPEALAGALIALAVDPGRAAAMGRAGRAAAEARFSLDAMVATYRGVYDRALAASGYRPRGSGEQVVG